MFGTVSSVKEPTNSRVFPKLFEKRPVDNIML